MIDDRLKKIFKEGTISEEEFRRLNNPNSRRGFFEKLGIISLDALLLAYWIGSNVGCEKKTPFEPDIEPDEPHNDEYNITVDCLDMTSLQGENFVDKVYVGDARVVKDGDLLEPGLYTFQHKGHSIELNYNGSVHDTVLCVRKPGSSNNLSQTKYNNPARIDLQKLGQGNNIHLELYKIPNWVKIDWVKEALAKHTAIYNHNVIAYLVNENGAYTQDEWNQYLPNIRTKINNALEQISPSTGKITATLDENASSGDIKVRLGKGPYYSNPTTGWSISNGIIRDSNIMIHALSSGREYLEELYHAIGVRSNIGANLRLSDEIANDTDTLNRFGKALMRIDYFLNPDTHL